MQFSVRTLWIIYSFCAVIMVISGICCYYAGYYAASKEFHSYYMAESLNDRISASLYTFYGDIDTDATTDVDAAVPPVSSPDEEVESEHVEAEPRLDQVEQDIVPSDGSLYEAYLIGFGAKRSADRYAAKLMREDLPARVITRENINSRGRKIVWYQVSIGPLPYHKLLEIVELLKYRDKLEGVVLVEHKV